MESKETYNYNTASSPRIVLACSGGSDLGELSDRVARKLRNNGIFTMKCLAMVGANEKEFIKTLKNSETLVIDGCPVDCGKKIMEEAWLTDYKYIRLTDLGYKKGQTPVTNELVDEVYNNIVNNTNVQVIKQDIPVKPSCCK